MRAGFVEACAAAATPAPAARPSSCASSTSRGGSFASATHRSSAASSSPSSTPPLDLELRRFCSANLTSDLGDRDRVLVAEHERRSGRRSSASSFANGVSAIARRGERVLGHLAFAARASQLAAELVHLRHRQAAVLA